ncbi:MAG: hypothetical protein M1823_001154 [Watsoniomyces obsoletus]|nr:MAG: hypothetical protein M1823_001154 [Watsoniomyces obsoletus]
MDEETVEQFIAITNSSADVARQYLNLSDGRLEEAVQLFFDAGGMEAEPEPAVAATVPTTSSTSRPPIVANALSAQTGSGRITGAQPYVDATGAVRSGVTYGNDGAPRFFGSTSGLPTDQTEQDEEIARRLQEEFYGEHAEDMDGVRAPVAPTRETLVGPDADWDEGDDDEDMGGSGGLAGGAGGIAGAAFGPHGRTRLSAGRGRDRPGIFNQLETPSVWEEGVTADPDRRRRVLSQATGGASESSSKASLLAEMYRPPVEIISRLQWSDARDEGKRSEKWLLVNVQDPSIFDCQLLNRDIWKDKQIQETVRENFVFMQFTKDDPRGAPYVQFYFKEKDILSAYPHIAIVDPRTGEQVKVWSGPPVPKPMEFLMQLYEFLERFSLAPGARNPIPEALKGKGRMPAVDVDRMTEEQMLEMAMKNSLGEDKDAGDMGDDQLDGAGNGSMTPQDKGKGKARAVGTRGGVSYINGSSGGNVQQQQQQSPSTTTTEEAAPETTHASNPLFNAISSDHPHIEPGPDNTTTTRIQFRHSGGRIIRRFLLTDPVRRIYEWLKAEPLEGKQGKELELVCSGRNLMDLLDVSIEDAGLKNQTVMIEFLE